MAKNSLKDEQYSRTVLKMPTLIKSSCSMLWRRTRTKRELVLVVFVWTDAALLSHEPAVSLMFAVSSLADWSGMPSTFRRSDTFILAVASPIESPS